MYYNWCYTFIKTNIFYSSWSMYSWIELYSIQYLPCKINISGSNPIDPSSVLYSLKPIIFMSLASKHLFDCTTTTTLTKTSTTSLKHKLTIGDIAWKRVVSCILANTTPNSPVNGLGLAIVRLPRVVVCLINKLYTFIELHRCQGVAINPYNSILIEF